MNNNPPPTLTATVINLPKETQTNITLTRHPHQPNGHTHTLTFIVQTLLEVSLSPDDLQAILTKAA